jgi:hypothetical protein
MRIPSLVLLCFATTTRRLDIRVKRTDVFLSATDRASAAEGELAQKQDCTHAASMADRKARLARLEELKRARTGEVSRSKEYKVGGLDDDEVLLRLTCATHLRLRGTVWESGQDLR